MVQRFETVTAGEDEELASSLVHKNLPLIKDEEYIYKLIESLSLIWAQATSKCYWKLLLLGGNCWAVYLEGYLQCMSPDSATIAIYYIISDGISCREEDEEM